MFRLEKNDFFEKGFCRYIDEHGNKAFFQRDEGTVSDGFTMRVRLVEDGIKVEPVHIAMPVPFDYKGTELKLHFSNDSVYTHSSKVGIEGVTFLLQRWIDMLKAIDYASCDNAMVIKSCPELTEEDVEIRKLAALLQYEELNDVINSVFGGSVNPISHNS